MRRRVRPAALAVVCLWALGPGVANAVTQDRTQTRTQARDWPSENPPRPLPARESKFPPYEVRTLPNGLQVVVVLHHEQPAVSMRLLIRAGAAQDPEGKAGVASLAAALLDQGTTNRSAQQIAETIDTIGGALGAGAGTDLSYVNVLVMKDSFDFALSMLSDVTRNPAFRAEEIERQRQQEASGLRVSYEDPEYLAGIVFDRLVFGFHPYGTPNTGTPDSISQITRDDLLAFHQQYFRPNNAILAIVGDVTTEEAFAGAQKVFGDWQRGDVPVRTSIDPPDPTRRVIVVDKPDAVQTEIRVGHIGLPRKHRDYMALNLAIKILGGEGSNRLHRVLRSERGLTYGASADMEALKQSGEIVAQTNTRSEATGEALRLMVEEFWKLQRDQVGDRELADAQAYLSGNFPLTVETPDAIALQVINAVFYGLDLKELETFRERVTAVRVEDIQRAAQVYLRPDRLSVVLVGNAAAFVEQLRGVGFGKFEQIPISELDLSSATLRRDPKPAQHDASWKDAVAQEDLDTIELAPSPFASRQVTVPNEPVRMMPAAWRRTTPATWRRTMPAAWRGTTRGTSLQSEPDPQAVERGRQIVAQAIQAKGGIEKLKALKAVRATANTTINNPQAPVTAETVTAIVYPDRFRVEATLPLGRVVQVYADGRGWIEDAEGVRELSEALRNDFKNSVRRDTVPLLLAADAGEAQVRALAVTDDGGESQAAVEIVRRDSPSVTLYVSAKTGLIVKQTYKLTGPQGDEEVEESFSDYRPVEGIQVPYQALMRRRGQIVIERRLTRIEHNPSLDPSLFEPPPSP